jgi:DNA polymerase (family 10)
MNEEEMTARILNALDSPFLHVLGHLTGRLILRRDAYAIRTDEIFRKAAEKGVAIEINGSPDRLDISASLVRRALELGVKLVVSSDAHSTSELDNLDFAVRCARKGGATREQVLNTRGEKDFLAALKKPRH